MSPLISMAPVTSDATLLASIVTPAILNTVLARIALLFLAGADGDLPAARHAAARMLAGYKVETEDELRLAAEVISFGFHALEALSQAAEPNLPLTRTLRLRGCAVSLSRESHKSQRKLDQLQRDRRAGRATQAASPPEPARPQIDKAVTLVEATRQAMGDTANSGGKTWAQAYQQRQTARRIAGNLKKNQAAVAPVAVAPVAVTPVAVTHAAVTHAAVTQAAVTQAAAQAT
jgi:hypothetical protein